MEIKHLDSIINGTIAANGTCTCINNIAEGSGVNQRVGRSVRARYLQYDVMCIPAVSTGQDTVSVGFYWDLQANGSTAAYADVYDVNLPAYFNAFRNMNNIDRFVKLGGFELGPTAYSTAAATANAFLFNTRRRGIIKIPFKLAQIRYGATGASVPNTGAILITFATYRNDNTMTISGTVRFAYVDA